MEEKEGNGGRKKKDKAGTEVYTLGRGQQHSHEGFISYDDTRTHTHGGQRYVDPVTLTSDLKTSP